MKRIVEKVACINSLNEKVQKKNLQTINKKEVINKPFKEVFEEEVAKLNAASFILENELVLQSLMLSNERRNIKWHLKLKK